MFDDMLHAKRLRPLMPRPTSSITRDAMFCVTPHTCFLNCCSSSSRAKSFSAFHSHLCDASVDQTETGFLTNNGEPLLSSSRWNPTAEQIQALEEMYKTGLRTPSADQIQKIAAKLSKFGKIEGKNVFYWFQNHKARERQKRRRLMDANNQPQLAEMHDNNIGTNKPGINMKVMDVEPPEKWSTYSTCGTTSEDSASKNRTVEAESKRNVWAQFDEKELEKQTICKKRIKKATFQVDMAPLSNYYIFSTRITTQRSSKQPIDYNNEDKIASRNNLLELFPLGINNQSDITTEEECGVLTENNVAFCPRQFFEFLPLKS